MRQLDRLRAKVHYPDYEFSLKPRVNLWTRSSQQTHTRICGTETKSANHIGGQPETLVGEYKREITRLHLQYPFIFNAYHAPYGGGIAFLSNPQVVTGGLDTLLTKITQLNHALTHQLPDLLVYHDHLTHLLGGYGSRSGLCLNLPPCFLAIRRSPRT